VIRRSFRIGVWLGVLGGLGYALLRLVQGTRDATPAPASVPPQPGPRLDLRDERPAGAPARETARVAPAPEPVRPAPAPERPAAAAPAPAPASAPASAPAPAAPAPAATPAEVAPPKPAVTAKKVPAKKAAPKKVLEPWVDPKGDLCPKTHPVKAKLASKIFQVTGNFAYDRTKPDRCYRDADAAEKDGFRAAKR
jgi:hypothetical protein